jgi:CBS domain-containing protein
MTDFRDRPSVTIDASVGVEDALEHMRHAGVRSAFVTEDRTAHMVGLITAYDLMGEKPIRHMRVVGVPRNEVLVRDLMVVTQDWCVADMTDIERATVGDVAELFERLAITHLPVVETTRSGSVQVRGLLSGAKVTRVLSRYDVTHADSSSGRRRA